MFYSDFSFTAILKAALFRSLNYKTNSNQKHVVRCDRLCITTTNINVLVAIASPITTQLAVIKETASSVTVARGGSCCSSMALEYAADRQGPDTPELAKIFRQYIAI